MLLVNQFLRSKIINCSKEVEALTVQLPLKQPINLCLIYNPPNSESSYRQKLLAYLTDITQSTEEVILLGVYKITMFNKLTTPHTFMVIFWTLLLLGSVDTVSDINLTQEFKQAIKSDHYLVSF